MVKAYIFACKYATKSLILLNASTKLSITKKLKDLSTLKTRNYTNTLTSGTPSYKHITQHQTHTLLNATQLSISIYSINIIQHILQHIHAHSLLTLSPIFPSSKSQPSPNLPPSPSNFLPTSTHSQPVHIISNNSSLVQM